MYRIERSICSLNGKFNFTAFTSFPAFAAFAAFTAVYCRLLPFTAFLLPSKVVCTAFEGGANCLEGGGGVEGGGPAPPLRFGAACEVSTVRTEGV